MDKKKSFAERMVEAVESSVFCYAKIGGQGFVFKENCPCYVEGSVCCQAKKDKDTFTASFNQLDDEHKDKNYDKKAKIMLSQREDVIANLPEDLKQRQWFKDNVTYSGNIPNKK